jgi:hypothetical protein
LEEGLLSYPFRRVRDQELVYIQSILLGKWLWRFAVERENFWRQIVDKKYGSVAAG